MSLPRIDVDLACRSCGYDLRGVAADGRCPECGAPAMASILARADAEVASLPPLDRPALAGASLVATVAALGTGTTVVFLADFTGDDRREVRGFAVGCAFAALFAGWTMAARFGSRHRRERRAFLAALAASLAAAVAEALRPAIPLGLTMATNALVIWFMRPLFAALGRRSVPFRRQGPSRQPIGPLAVAAGFAAAMGLAHAGLASMNVEAPALDHLLMLEATVGGLVCVGLIYLCANAVIIARSLGEVAIDPDQLVKTDRRDTGPID